MSGVGPPKKQRPRRCCACGVAGKEACPSVSPQRQVVEGQVGGTEWGALPFLWEVMLRLSPLWLPRVEEDLDQILNLGTEPKAQPQPKPKPAVAAKPALPRKPAVPPRAGPSEAVAGQQKQQQQIQAMDEMDILQYIRDHDTPGQATPSLF